MTIADTNLKIPARHPGLPGVLTRGWSEALQSIESVTPFWPELVEQSASDNPFFDPAFLKPASVALGAPVELVTVTGTDGRLLGALPVTHGRFGHFARALRGFAHDYAPFGQPLIAATGLSENAAALIDGALKQADPTGVLVLPELIESNSATEALVVAASVAGRSVTRIDTYARASLDRADGTDPRAALPKRRRKEYARLLRRLGDKGMVAFEHAVTPPDVTARFDDFIALEGSGWKGRRQTSMSNNPAFAAFAREAIAALARRGAASVITLRVGERPAAILVCLHQNRTAFTWKIAYDEELAVFSPGAQLMLEAPNFLFANPRVERIDSCATPNHPMIDHLWRGRQPMTTLVIGPEQQRWRQTLSLAAHRTETKLRVLAKRSWQSIRPRTR